MARAAHDDLLSGRPAQEEQPQISGCARRPEAGKVTRQLMHPERGVTLVRVEQLEGLGEPPLVRLAERGE
ncbi:MAG: hypothetical protein ACYC9W_03285 [Candidatus Limnocylindria bacterium]